MCSRNAQNWFRRAHHARIGGMGNLSEPPLSPMPVGIRIWIPMRTPNAQDVPRMCPGCTGCAQEFAFGFSKTLAAPKMFGGRVCPGASCQPNLAGWNKAGELSTIIFAGLYSGSFPPPSDPNCVYVFSAGCLKSIASLGS